MDFTPAQFAGTGITGRNGVDNIQGIVFTQDRIGAGDGQFADGVRPQHVAKIQASDFDSVIVSRVVDTRLKETINRSYPGTPYEYSRRWDSYYARSMGQIRSPDYHSPLVPVNVGTTEVEIRNIYSLETNLYKVADKGLVSSIMSDIYTGQPHNLMIRSFVKTLITRYSSGGLI